MELKQDDVYRSLWTCHGGEGMTRIEKTDVSTVKGCNEAAKKVEKIDPKLTCKWSQRGNIMFLGDDKNIYLGTGSTKIKKNDPFSCGLHMKEGEASDTTKVPGDRVYSGVTILPIDKNLVAKKVGKPLIPLSKEKVDEDKKRSLHKKIAKKFDKSEEAYQFVSKIINDAEKKMNDSQDILGVETYSDGIETDMDEIEFTDASVTFSPSTPKLEEIWNSIKDLPNRS